MNNPKAFKTMTTDLNASTTPRICKLGSRIFVANVLPVCDDGSLVQEPDIQKQTHAAFRGLQSALRIAGAELEDLVRINTYYVYTGPENATTRYWEEMTEVRLKYFPDPGPVGTALRISGTCARSSIIQLEAEALLPKLRTERLRVMPADSWDWSIPIPLSQGWRQDDYVWVGGQISADRRGHSVNKDDVSAQTVAVLRHIGNVLSDAGATFEDLLHLKICYSNDGDPVASDARLSKIMEVVRSVCGSAVPAVTAFGAKLIYEGLLLEIDASAVLGDKDGKRSPGLSKNKNWAAPHQGLRRGRYAHISGQSAQMAATASLDEQVWASVLSCIETLDSIGMGAGNVGRLTVLVSRGALRRASMGEALAIQQLVESNWPTRQRPAVTVVEVVGLPSDADVQADAFAAI